MDKIVSLSRADYKDIFDLSQFAFQYNLSEEALIEKAREADRHQIVGYRMDGNLAGKLHIIPLEVTIQGKKFAMGGISSVATWPEYRRLGIAKKLLHHALVKMKEQGQVLSYLHPFSVGFYRKYGWELAFSRRHDIIPIDQLKQHWNAAGYVRRTEADIALLDHIYAAYAQKFNGMLVRDTLWWQQRVLTDKEMNIAVAYNDKEEAEGYVMYKVRNNELTVNELAYKNVNGRNLLYEFIGNHDSMANEVKWVVPTNNNVPFMINNPVYEQMEQPYFMARIVDVKAFLEQYVYMKAEADTKIHLTVEDECIQENSGTYEVDIVDGKATLVEQVEQTNLTVQCSVQYLTAMCLGYKRPLELYEDGLITGDIESIDQLEKMLPSKQTFLTDFF